MTPKRVAADDGAEHGEAGGRRRRRRRRRGRNGGEAPLHARASPPGRRGRRLSRRPGRSRGRSGRGRRTRRATRRIGRGATRRPPTRRRAAAAATRPPRRPPQSAASARASRQRRTISVRTSGSSIFRRWENRLRRLFPTPNPKGLLRTSPTLMPSRQRPRRKRFQNRWMRKRPRPPRRRRIQQQEPPRRRSTVREPAPGAGTSVVTPDRADTALPDSGAAGRGRTRREPSKPTARAGPDGGRAGSPVVDGGADPRGPNAALRRRGARDEKRLG